MTSQSKKKYSKYLTGVASAALVASAVAPVVSAADFNDVVDNNSHKEAIDALAATGVISGYPDGSFKPNKTLTRSDVVKLMGKWLVSKGYSIPTDYKTNPRFTDLTSNSNDELLQSAAIVKDNDVFRGYEDGSLGAAGSITRENMAVVLVRAFDSVNKTSLLTYVQEQEFDKDVVDLNKAKAEARTAIDVLDYFDITNPAAPNFRPKETTTRAQFASFLYKTIQVEVPGEEPEAPEVSEITSVTATGEKQLELTGKSLHVLKAEQLKIEGNELASFKANEDGTKATIELKNELTSGKEMTLHLTTKAEAEGEEDVVTSYKFTYELTVEKVTATTTQVNAGTAGQKLAFNVDGKPADMKKLTDAGYKVAFQSTNTDVFSDQTTGTLKDLATTDKFSYKVVVTDKDGKTVESELVDVKVVDFANTVSEISKVSVKQGGVTVESGKISLEDGAVDVKVEETITLSGATKTDSTATFTSSNPSVATVTSAGKVTPISTGEVTIVAKVGDVTKDIKLTVGAGKRVASSATLSSTDTKLIKGTTQGTNVVVKDQYGDLYAGDVTVESKDAEIATVESATLKVTEGKATVNVKGVKAGTTTVQVKSGDTVLGNIAVAVSDDETVATKKLETVSASDDLTIDAINGSLDGSVTLAWKQYNSQGFYVGDDKIGAGYEVTSSNPSVATVTKDAETGELTVEAKEAGTTNILIKQGDITRATATITVVNTTPSISSVEIKNLETIIKAGNLNEAVVLPEGIKLTSTEFTPKIADNGDIYIGEGENGTVLGTVATSYSGNTADITDLKISGGTLTGEVQSGAKGTIVVSVTKAGQSSAIATKQIEVNVPASN
ncbi:hypothetical protein CSV80_05240 [Sporosarcina sp. P12(2017)]|uniref:S-layer homology domain-containing protein n=1 Tax=unclassified Sporosarcina TaxID=2647733 RepID=UPI000C16F900|nr:MULTISPECIES: S-layer homology domain-containing protein [unclassified Sporosarcina]PIC58404.1 hypothetical protein CSV81_04490 [Sporosarcina sp. P10]PIC61431.1 hypothetical protein CSV80_05240 [Sporosarcina sp. P12(2017)]